MLFILQLRYSLLISGSKGYSNYRHQSDIMTLSTILHSDKDNIVTTFIYDDIAYNHKNPFKGKIFNDYLHTNIYNKSYINSTNINIDSINESMSFQFTKNDTLFVYYDDHGAPGMLCTPKNRNCKHDEIYADDLEQFLNKISKKVNKILFVIEACYSGSIAKYISLKNVLTISSATSIQSSYSAKWDSSVGAHLTNLFSLNFIDYINFNKDDKILNLINYVSRYTERSSINVFGDMSILNYSIKDFIGTTQKIQRDDSTKNNNIKNINNNAIDSHETLLYYYRQKMNDADSLMEKLYYVNKYMNEYKRRIKMQQKIDNIITKIHGNKYINEKELENLVIRNFKCYKNATNVFKSKCGYIDEVETMYLMPKLGYLCNKYNDEIIINSFDAIC